MPQANAILFDIRGEYKPLGGEEFWHLRVAGPGDLAQPSDFDDGVLYLPSPPGAVRQPMRHALSIR